MIVVIAAAGLVWRQPAEPAPASVPNAGAGTRPPTAEKSVAPANDKSIAVLPFTNLSPDKENEYFADGIHEDVLTNLQNIRELRVVSRTSVIGYRGTTKKIGEIARELGVAYILEGSVRRAGNTVRVSAQLIDARTDAHLWSPPPYDRELTATSIFAIQSDIAESIARALEAKLSPQEKSLVDRRPTENLEAYNLFLKAREQRNSGFTEQTRTAAIAFLDEAVRLDPKFARAWAELSWAHASLYFLNFDHSSARAAKSKAAIELATLLEPEAPDVILNLGYYHLYCRRDYARAMQEFEKLSRLQPGGAEPRYAISNLQAHAGKWREALEGFRQATRLEPQNLVYASLFGATAQRNRRWDEVLAEARRLAALPTGAVPLVAATEVTFWAQGSTRDMEEVIARLQNQGSTGTALPNLQLRLALARGDFRDVIRLGPLQSAAVTGVRLDVARALPVATSLLALGDAPAARAQLEPLPDKLRAQLKVDPENPLLWSDLGMVEALLGRKDEALRSARRAVELFPISLDPADAPYCRAALAFVLMWVGDKEGALAEYKFLLGVPMALSNVTGRTEVNVHLMRHHPYFFPLQGDPRFEALLNDPKNNQPLF